MRIGVAVWLCVVACGDNRQVDIAGVTPGSILVPRGFYVGGAALLRSWYDTRERVECEFRAAEDGRYRCLPNGNEALGIDPESFADPECTVPALLDAPCGHARFALGVVSSTPTCADGDAIAVYELGEPRPATRYYYANSGRCMSLEVPVDAVVLVIGSRVAPSRFVGADLVVQPSSGRIAPYAFEADDGTVEQTSAWDTERNGECGAAWEEEEPQPRCRPREIALHYDWLWSDPTCSARAAADLSQNRPCAVPTAVLTYDENLGQHFGEIGAPVAQAYSSQSGVCAPQVVAGDHFYVEGGPIPDDAFPPMTRHLDGDGRVRVLRFGDAEDRVVAAGVALYDTTSQRICSPVALTNGTTVCLPSTGWTTVAAPSDHNGFYLDSSCTVALAVYDRDAVPDGVIVQAPAANSACSESRVELRERGARYTGPVYYSDGTTCVSRAPEPNQSYWIVGTAVPKLPTLQRF